MPKPKRANPNERYHIRAVERALFLLKTFLGNEPELSAGEISKRIELDPSTTFRMLVTLEAHGLLRQDPATGKYRLGVTCLELGSQFLKINDVRKSAVDVMQGLRDEFGETVHLGVLDGDEIVYLEKLPGLHAIGLMSSRVGGRAPAHSTAIGKVLLAHLPESDRRARFPRGRLVRRTPATITDWPAFQAECARIQENQYGIDNEENEPGVKCVAVPIFSHKGVSAALSISGPAARMDEHMNQHALIDHLKKATTQVSTEIGWGRGVDQIGVLTAPAAPSRAARRNHGHSPSPALRARRTSAQVSPKP